MINPRTLSKIAGRLLQHPASPYYEDDVRTEVENICRENGLKFRRDEYGNIFVRFKNANRQRPLVLAAHMDHPGFEIIRRLSADRWMARFLGGVPDHYFKKGVPVRLMPGSIPAAIAGGTRNAIELKSRNATDAKLRFAVWELEDFSIREGRIHARACDDTIGVAAILATLIELKRSAARVDVIGLISRAEEVGFHGALAAMSSRQLPRNALVISLETSRELPPAKMGEGVIIRVGDKTSIFDPQSTRFLADVCSELRHQNGAFRFQRALMFGGTCEATAFQEFGFQTAAVCVALGNYHNCGARDKIAAEYIDLNDACSMVELLAATALALKDFQKIVAKLRKRLDGMLKEARTRLKRNAPMAIKSRA